MFFFLRALCLLAPAGVIAGLFWLAGQARQLSYRDDTDLVIEVGVVPERFNPLAPGMGVQREITELLFDRLFRLDDELRIQPHLVEEWHYRHQVIYHFSDEEKAAEGAAEIDRLRDRWPEWSLVDFGLEGDNLLLTSSDPTDSWTAEIAGVFDSDALSPLLHVRLKVREAVEPSLRDFLAASVEKEKLRHVDIIPGGRSAELFLQGETDLFLKELRIYYESNRHLEPEIVVIGPEPAISSLHFEMKLREDLSWHDGESVTADDLIFTFKEITRAGSPWPQRDAFSFVESIDEVEDFRVRVRLQEFYAPALECWAKMPLLPAHRLRASVTPAEWETFFRNPVGTGPYRLESVNPGKEVALTSHADYLRGQPRQPTVRYVSGEVTERQRLTIRLGKVDIFTPNATERRRMESGALDAETVQDVLRYQSLIAWNLDRPRFADPKVRRALAHLAEADQLPERVQSARIGPWQGIFLPGSWFCEERSGPLPHDVEKAEQLLGEAGWRREEGAGGAGEWSDREGNPAGFSLCFDAGNALHAELANLLATAWKAAGVAVTLEPVDWPVLIESRLKPRNFDALLLDWELDFSRDHFAVWHSSEAGAGGANFSGLRNQEIDGLLERLRRENEPEAIVQWATELQRKIRDLQPCLFLCGAGRSLALRGGAVSQARPLPDGGWNTGPVSVGRAGLYASRPWWVRTELINSP